MASTWGSIGCVAITAKGVRCNRGHQTEIPIVFEWDPVSGVGVGAPSVPLCRMHNYLWDLEPGERVEIVFGWLGRGWNPVARCWTVTDTVYDMKDSRFVSPHWWALRRPLRFGECDRVVYNEAP